jgi:hypothetical protein
LAPKASSNPLKYNAMPDTKKVNEVPNFVIHEKTELIIPFD